MFFSSLRLSLHKKKKIFLLLQKTQNLNLFRLLRAPLNTHTHIKDHHHGKFCDDDDKKTTMQVLLFFLFFSFLLRSSLSLSLLSRVIEDFLINRGRESTDFFFASSPSIFKM